MHCFVTITLLSNNPRAMQHMQIADKTVVMCTSLYHNIPQALQLTQELIH